MLRRWRWDGLLAAYVACTLALMTLDGARADTPQGGLAEAYRTNPSLNAQRANVRSIDENVSQALAGYRPRAAITAVDGEQSISTTTKVPGAANVTQSGFNSPFQVDAAKANIEATQAQVQAAEIALNGVREEARRPAHHARRVERVAGAGERARRAVTAQRDRVVASYTLLAAVGRLDPAVLHLAVQVYQSQVHYMQVRDAWAGTRNPDGR